MAKYYLSAILFFFLFQGNAFAQPSLATPPKDAAQYVQISEADHDFGDITYGKAVSYTLWVKNISKDSLIFSNVETSCGCTVPQWKRGKYAANDSFAVKITFNGYTEGKFNKTISLLFNGDVVKIVRFHGVGVMPKASQTSNSDDDEDDDDNTAVATSGKNVILTFLV